MSLEQHFIFPLAFKGSCDYLVRTRTDELVCIVEAKARQKCDKHAFAQTLAQLCSLSFWKWLSHRRIAILTNGLQYVFIQLNKANVALTRVFDVKDDLPEIVGLLDTIFRGIECVWFLNFKPVFPKFRPFLRVLRGVK